MSEFFGVNLKHTIFEHVRVLQYYNGAQTSQYIYKALGTCHCAICILWASGTPNSRASPGSPHYSYATVCETLSSQWTSQLLTTIRWWYFCQRRCFCLPMMTCSFCHHANFRFSSSIRKNAGLTRISRKCFIISRNYKKQIIF